VIVGAWLSSTVTVKLQVAVSGVGLAASTIVQVIVVIPFWNTAPVVVVPLAGLAPPGPPAPGLAVAT